MRNFILPLGALCLSLCGTVIAGNEVWVQRLQQDAQYADDNAIRFEENAKAANGLEAFKQESEAQFYRKLAQYKRDLASAVETGNQMAIHAARTTMREHEQTRIVVAEMDPGNPFAPTNPRTPFTPESQPETNPNSNPNANPSGGQPKEWTREKAEWFSNLANETQKLAESKRTWAKDQPRKMRREIEKYADILDRLATAQRALGNAMMQGNTEEMMKVQKEILKIRDDLKNCNMGLLPNIGL